MKAELKLDLKFDEFLSEVVGTASNQALEAAAIVVADEAVKNVTRRGVSTATSRKKINEYKRLITTRGRGANRTITSVGLRTGKGGRILKQDRVAALAAQEEKLNGSVDPPGGFPRARTGRLARDIGHEAPKDGKVRVGVSATNRYGAIHEFGGVINHPGGTSYFRRPGGLAAWVGKASPLARLLPKTKPHQIRIPARPYVRPALASSGDKATDAFVAIMRRLVFGGGS